MDPKTLTRFWAKVDTAPNSTGCLVWTGATEQFGYGVFRVGAKVRKAHVVAWELEHGAVPVGALLMHLCDVPSCVNVAHLRLGTHKQNFDDMVAKGRRRWFRKPPPKGA